MMKLRMALTRLTVGPEGSSLSFDENAGPDRVALAPGPEYDSDIGNDGNRRD